ncbi:MAG TPA: MFS transporter [Kofleriaceae bacterium]|jgi:fucose permease|nr:MFS transporter [Kofleriaceae bacterium]
MAESAGSDGFVRDRATTLSYAVIGYYAFYLYLSGPAIALLRSELHLSYTVTSLSSALWAGAAILSGLSFPWIAHRVPRRALLWRSTFGIAVGSALLATSRGISSALVAIAVLSFTGTAALMVPQAALADRHGPRLGRALVEANIGAAACAVVAPLVLSALDHTGVGWRVGPVLPVFALLAMYLTYRRDPLPAPAVHTAATPRSRRVPRSYWLQASLVACSMAIEMCMVFFSVDLLASTTGLTVADATATMIGFYLGILLGRIAGSVLARRPERSGRLILASLSLAFAGVLLCWLSGHALVASAGLFMAGAGIANLYPLTLSRALAAAPDQSDAASAHTQLLGGGLAIVMPALLGTLANRFGVAIAFAVVPSLIAGSALLLLIVRLVTRTPRDAVSPRAPLEQR